MYENELNAEERTVVQSEGMGEEQSGSGELNPQSASIEAAEENSAENKGDVAEIPDPEKMSDEEFDDYLKSAKDGNLPKREAAHEKETAEAAKKIPDAEETDRAEEQEKTKPFKTFQTRTDWQKSIDAIVGERLKSTREQKEKMDSLSNLAAAFYGVEDGKEALTRLIDDLRSQNADKSGVDVETYKKREQEAIDAQRYREQQQAQAQRADRINEIRKRWEEESEELRRVIPDFDLEKAIENKTFYEALAEGQSVGTAYIKAYNAAASTAKEDTVKTHRRGIAQNGNSKSGGVGAVQTNIETMSDAEFEKHITKIKNGG